MFCIQDFVFFKKKKSMVDEKWKAWNLFVV